MVMKPNLKEIEKAIMELKHRGELNDEEAYLVFDKDLQHRIIDDNLTNQEREYFQTLEAMTTPELKNYLDSVLNDFKQSKKTGRRP